jgi:hypothetical protein
MPSRNESALARAKLENETPAPVDDGSLLKVQEEAAAIIREAQDRNPSSSDEFVASAIDDVNRSYYNYLIYRRCRRSKPPQGGQ